MAETLIPYPQSAELRDWLSWVLGGTATPPLREPQPLDLDALAAGDGMTPEQAEYARYAHAEIRAAMQRAGVPEGARLYVESIRIRGPEVDP